MGASKSIFLAHASSTPGWHDVNWHIGRVARHRRQCQAP